ncbi:D-alanyl-D-alanine carboxypeptidase/D-alanyl-D-alanine-endopeptidase [Sphingobacterium sp. SGG-5]|uniref:D-alanyl-D-alanine carboxypeptidase/D-alanyl-D-alanine endopeptidase n=1 Tax=Sphingobacterium sp. SGG-5 TaxID=2710881 RepID=UPI0013EB7075|nr:D-alanyl-D-alanine carboxypeptidase/D-alanyl-D-alanine-endopeptidase [Sphingobacterium sp. SGG-5]NGM62600.1 D-alanyl-D-alanine carboxypeptidase/D-alanyl-D-alanine-endopeptidase [Sphingobacterium sp. SGG-5]
MKKYITLSLLLLSAQISLKAQDIATRLNEAFLTLTNQPTLRHGTAAFHVIDGQSGAVVYAKNSHLGLPPASTLKTITSITALDLLGPDYTYKTTLYYTGDIDSLGILHGDIVVQGSGDPTLGSSRFEGCDEKSLLEQWATAIQTAGITQVTGRVIGDDRLYDGHEVPGGWPWNDIGNYYGAGISGLNWRENKVGVIFRTGSVNSPAQIAQTSTDIAYLQLINTVKVGHTGSGDKVFAYTAPYLDKIYLKGTFAQGLKKTVEIALPDPAFDLAYHLRDFLTQTGIPVVDTVTTGQRLVEAGAVFPTKSKELHIHISPKLSDIIYPFNHKSINLYGEALLKSIAQMTGQKTNTADGVEYLKKYWTQRLGLAEAEINVIDGSGLSPQNFVTAEAMAKIMQYARSRPWYTSFQRSLPTINQMTMKSGTIRGTLGYTGYQTSKSGKQYTFALLLYNYSGSATAMRQKMFTVLNNLK